MEREELLRHARAMYEFSQTPENVKSALEKEFPALKESEDERIRKALVKTFEKKLEIGFEWTEFGIPNRSVLDWLEKQKEQQPAEWDEEDEKMFIGVIDTIKDAIAECDCDDVGARAMFIYEKELNWLENRFKSLHPQPNTVPVESATKFANIEYERGVKDGIQSEKSHHWKPSEEQMDALRMVAYKMGNSCFGKSWANDENLHSLYVALKKLM